MIEKLNMSEKASLIKKMSFYDLFTCSIKNGKQFIIKFFKSAGDINYSDLRFTTFERKDFQNYYEKERRIIKLLTTLIGYFGEEVFIVNYGDKWMRDKRISPKLNNIFKQHQGIDDDTVLKSSDKNEIGIIAKSILRYNTFAEFVVASKNVVITPTDHLDVFISAKDDICNDLKELIKNCEETRGFFYVKKRKEEGC